MDKDKQIIKRFEELCDRAETRHAATFTEFLNLDEISTLKSLRLPCTLYGGYENAERCVAAFGETDTFPIACIELAAKGARFAEKLTHRDYLGTLLGTGIERSVLGDILINGTTAYAFCLESIADYLCESITRVKHTAVTAKRIETLPDFINEKPDESTLTVSSLRLDAVIAGVYRLSRSEAARLIKSEKAFINARLETRDSKTLDDGDTVSVRGYGKFIFEGEIRKTKKERLVIGVRIYP